MVDLGDLRSLATRDIGPLPVWGWGIAGVGGVWLGRRVSSAFGGTADGDGVTVGSSQARTVASSAGAVGLPNAAAPVTPTTVEAPTSNTEWRQRALVVLQAAGASAVVADQALSTYLAQGVMTAEQRQLIEVALQQLGLPPDPPTILQPEAPPATVNPVTPSVSTPAAPVLSIAAQKVTAAYLDLLGRAPDAAGLDFWVQKLESGTSIEDVRRGISGSPEATGAVPVAPPAGTLPELTMPTAAPPVPTASARSHTVARGETLAAIGKRYGVPWASIYAANRAVIGSNPNLIKPGQVLTIPAT